MRHGTEDYEEDMLDREFWRSMVITGKAEAVAGAYVKARSEIQTLLTMDGQGARANTPRLPTS